MNLPERITIDSDQCGGRPCIRGYRIRVSDNLELIAAGASREEILEDYNFLESDDISTALTYAARQTNSIKPLKRVDNLQAVDVFEIVRDICVEQHRFSVDREECSLPAFPAARPQDR